MKHTENKYWLFDNDTVSIAYDFWSDGGVMYFMLTNKSEQPIYVDWKKSSLIVNAVKLDYWNDKEVTQSSSFSIYKSYQYEGVPLLRMLSQSTSGGGTNTVATVTKEERITFVPPHSSIFNSSFILMPDYEYKLQKNRIRTVDTIETYKVIVNLGYQRVEETRERTSRFYEVSFDSNSSFFNFRNYITYSFDEKFSDERRIDNAFYISKVTEMDEEQFKQEKYRGIPSEGYDFPYTSPDCFWIKVLPKNAVEK
ncbi:MAG: hypothetical protein KGZ58_00270 [Ignavibacteriales bacterium]|nr:hypothetical protein [Ignavibacteriales bacterium]